MLTQLGPGNFVFKLIVAGIFSLSLNFSSTCVLSTPFEPHYTVLNFTANCCVCDLLLLQLWSNPSSSLQLVWFLQPLSVTLFIILLAFDYLLFELVDQKLDLCVDCWQVCFTSQAKMEPRHGIVKAFPKVKRVKVLNEKDAPPVKKKSDGCDITGCYITCYRICFKAFQS